MHARGTITVDMFTTLDGVVQAPGEPGEDRDGGFRHGGWQVPLLDEDSGAQMVADILEADALLLGRRTYDIFAAYWPAAPDGDPLGAHLNGLPKYVVSRSAPDLAWADTTHLRDVPSEVAALRERHERIHVTGSPTLARSLLEADLVDRIRLWLNPIVLGSGKRFFDEGTAPTALRLAEPPRAYPRGAVLLTYERAGAVEYGDMAWSVRTGEAAPSA